MAFYYNFQEIIGVSLTFLQKQPSFSYKFITIASVELEERRLQIQKYNNKCKYESGYISGDIKLDPTKQAIIRSWQKYHRNSCRESMWCHKWEIRLFG